jgi:hypothetical protein
MPRYFFHVYDDQETIDQDGLELPNVEVAEWEALRGARSLASEQVLMGRLRLTDRIDVTNETGTVIATVTFRDAVIIEG